MSDRRRPALDGIKIVEFAHLIAGPLAGSLMADLGAEVVHVEPPGVGDAARQMGPDKDGVNLWWKVSGRNKRSVTLDLRAPDGQAVARQLVSWADVVITNFRFDTLKRWGLDWDTLHDINRRLVMLQISGHGMTTTKRNAPGFGKVGEAMSGVVAITGFADGPPVHTGFSHADSVTALMGAFAISAALVRRDDDDFEGELIDLALFETLFRLIEWQVVVHDQLGVVPTRAGNQLFVAPGAIVNSYQTSDRRWLTVTSATPRSVQNIAQLLGLPAEDFATVPQQRANAPQVDRLLREWIAERTVDECVAVMAEMEVVASPVYTMDDIVDDVTYRERGDLVVVDDPDLGALTMQGIVPKLHLRPGAIRTTAPALGADNEFVLGEYLGIDPDRIRQLGDEGTL